MGRNNIGKIIEVLRQSIEEITKNVMNSKRIMVTKCLADLSYWLFFSSTDSQNLTLATILTKNHYMFEGGWFKLKAVWGVSSQNDNFCH